MIYLSDFSESLSSLCPNFAQKKYLLAVSGGVDSMVLLTLFKNSGLGFQVAHINYHLRDEESDKDENLVRHYCNQHDILVSVYNVCEKEKTKTNTQIWARKLRYEFFFRIMEEQQLDFLVTAHHLNDQLETFFINLSRGSGITGLSGIPNGENRILRPLLKFSKNDIYSFAKNMNVPYREDRTNTKDDYLRNRIRNRIVPKFLETIPHFLSGFEKSLSHLKEANSFIRGRVKYFLETSKEYNGKNDKKTVLFRKEKLLEEPEIVQYELLKTLGFKHKKEIKKMFSAASGSKFYSDIFALKIESSQWRFSPIEKKTKGKESAEEKENAPLVLLENRTHGQESRKISLNPYLKESTIPPKDKAWHVDLDKLNFPLYIRTWKRGDIFSPMGMNGKKKVAKYLREKKIPDTLRKKTKVLCDGKNRVLGILPYRQDQRFAANNTTKNILTFTL
ncbi:MAG: tRNA lysidine(34) synthetase TilS [Bergeyella sp.]|nr:tRNA lysidine(34) synthetase TilS [Bergeyella sp.]